MLNKGAQLIIGFFAAFTLFIGLTASVAVPRHQVPGSSSQGRNQRFMSPPERL